MESPQRENKGVDLGELIEVVSSWQKEVYNTYRENIQSEQEIMALEKEVSELRETEKLHLLELQDNSNTVSELQGILTNKVAVEDENRSLKKRMEEVKEKMNTLQQVHEAKLKAAQEEMIQLREVLKVEIEDVVDEVQQKSKVEQEELERIIKEKDSQIEIMQQQLKQADKEKQAEIMQIRFEYDTKMLKLQKENARKQQVPHSSSVNQDIFRKKLQHVKAESEREIQALKRTICELEQRVVELTESRQQPQHHQQQQGPVQGSMAKRIRRF